ncbi:MULTISPECIES: NERD domain-containing protein [unclassified Virgibacillus]|uniref:NERD domain-containing protein n=1 Tax=unclassified Virgibacillus TaxID=2620237 RepID=UPI0024DEFB32|nr:NERD domain-containing protein [Virgibacillus sp. LDC-1]
MAQLIKLQNYITRYEWDIYRYSTQFIRLKQENWNKLYHIWSNPSQVEAFDNEEEADSKIPRWLKFLRRDSDQNQPEIQEHTDTLPRSEMELKQYFLNKLYPFQLKWATSTVTDVSFFETKYRMDSTLAFFLQRFPDNYLIMYYPIFNIKKAPMETEIILITPVGIEIVYLLEGLSEDATIMASDERTWFIEGKHKNTKILNPVIALKRTEKIVRSILKSNDVEFSVSKTVLSRKHQIIFSNEPFQTRIVGTREFDKWFQEKRSLQSPLKNRQLKAADALLKQCETSSVKRPEWEEDTSTFTFVDEV